MKKELCEKILNEKVSRVGLKLWPWNYYCGLWEKHKPDENGREYIIDINKTRGVKCGKITLVHELLHLRDDLNSVNRRDIEVEEEAQEFCRENKKFVDYLWKKYASV